MNSLVLPERQRREQRRSAQSRPKTIVLSGWVCFGTILWTLDWLSINTDPSNVTNFGDTLPSIVTSVRAALPLLVFVVTLPALLSAATKHRSWAEKGFWIYGWFALLGCTGAYYWFNQAYWGFAFLGALGAAEFTMRRPDRLFALERLNWISWGVTTTVLTIMIFVARDTLLAPGSSDSGYGFINRVDTSQGFGMARETGLSRMAVVPAIISLAFFLGGAGWRRWITIPVLLASLYIIWIMQSRGALFSFAGALAFVMMFGNRSTISKALIVGAICVTVVTFAASPDLSDYFWQHITRGTGAEGFSDASGRYAIFDLLLSEWAKSPLFGFGPQADRLFGVNGQNAFIYALLCGGVFGALFFTVAMLACWRALSALALRVRRFPERERMMFQITGALFVFATLRSLPENNAALFSVDLLLQYPAMLYLITLNSK